MYLLIEYIGIFLCVMCVILFKDVRHVSVILEPQLIICATNSQASVRVGATLQRGNANRKKIEIC